MDSQDTELIKIATLQGRYGLESRQAVYDRINGLDIKPVTRGKISPQQLELLDKLDKHIRDGGAIADFPIQPEVEVAPLEKLDNSLDILDNQLDNAENLTAINVMAGLVEKMMGYVGNQRTAYSSASLSPPITESMIDFKSILIAIPTFSPYSIKA
ncbi:MAG: hypothetical protein ACKPJH_00695 [Dolichospermum sp.]